MWRVAACARGLVEVEYSVPYAYSYSSTRAYAYVEWCVRADEKWTANKTKCPRNSNSWIFRKRPRRCKRFGEVPPACLLLAPTWLHLHAYSGSHSSPRPACDQSRPCHTPSPCVTVCVCVCLCTSRNDAARVNLPLRARGV